MSDLDVDVSLDLGAFRLDARCSVPLEGITAIVGPSGSGKTTLLRVVAGLERSASGRIAAGDRVWLDGRRSVPAHRRRIGYVFQDGALFDHLSVDGNLRFALRFGARSGHGIGLAEVIAALELESLLERRTPTLSGGERQRVAIARALLTNPQLLLMDEPLSSVDQARRRSIAETIAALPRRFGVPILYVTHDHAELVRLGDRALLMDSGRIVFAGSVQEAARRAAFAAPAPRRDAASILEARVEGHRRGLTLLSLDGQTVRTPRIEAAPGSALRISVPARDVVLGLVRPEGLSIRNALDATIVSIVDRENGLVDIELALGNAESTHAGQSLFARITRDAADDLALGTQQRIVALIKSVAIDDGPA